MKCAGRVGASGRGSGRGCVTDRRLGMASLYSHSEILRQGMNESHPAGVPCA
jgi:hypothetical protein